MRRRSIGVSTPRFYHPSGKNEHEGTAYALLIVSGAHITSGISIMPPPSQRFCGEGRQDCLLQAADLASRHLSMSSPGCSQGGYDTPVRYPRQILVPGEGFASASRQATAVFIWYPISRAGCCCCCCKSGDTPWPSTGFCCIPENSDSESCSISTRYSKYSLNGS